MYDASHLKRHLWSMAPSDLFLTRNLWILFYNIKLNNQSLIKSFVVEAVLWSATGFIWLFSSFD